MLLIATPNESCQNSKKFKRNAISNRKGKSVTPAQTNAPISQTSSERLKLRNNELKMKRGQLQEEISKASRPVSADLCNYFKLIILETDQRKIYPS